MMTTIQKHFALIFFQFMFIARFSVSFTSFGLTRIKTKNVMTSKGTWIVDVAPQKLLRNDLRRGNKCSVTSTALFDVGGTPLLISYLRTDLLLPLFPDTGLVPISYSFILNTFLFTIFRKKLLSALTFSGYFHAMILGTILWATLGWRGWSVCVLYLIMGQMVTRVKFAEKARQGIAEGRG
jgi:Integral membrane protein DUF92